MGRTSALPLSIAAGAALCLVGSALTSGAAAKPGWEVVADGLDNPRQITRTGSGTLLVAEAGSGGPGPCVPGPEGGEVCFGRSGAVTALERRDGTWEQHRVLRRLPSLAAEDGSQAIGPSDTTGTGPDQFALSIGLGAEPAVRDDLPARGRLLGTLLAVEVDGNGASWEKLADLADFEEEDDPDGAGPDSNPTAVIRRGAGYVLTDAGGNSLVRVDRHGDVTELAVFPDRDVDAPPSLGLPPDARIPMQAVPTSVQRHDGSYLVSELTGFPFPENGARIWRVGNGEDPAVHVRGLTNVTDLAVHDGALYVVEISEKGLLDGVRGAVHRINRDGGRETLARGLFAPYGIAFQGGHAYVTTCSVCAGDGKVVRIDLGD